MPAEHLLQVSALSSGLAGPGNEQFGVKITLRAGIEKKIRQVA